MEEGLSNGVVYNLLQDGRGFLWIATGNGLNRYDGTEVVQYFATGDSLGPPDNRITSLVQLDTGHLLLGTEQGLATVELATSVFRTEPWPSLPDNPARDHRVHLLARDTRGQIWACTPHAVHLFDSTLAPIEVFRTQPDPAAHRFQNVFKISPLPSGEVLLWLHDGSIWQWIPGARVLEPLEEGDPAGLDFLLGGHYASVTLVDGRYLVRLKGEKILVKDLRSGWLGECDLPGLKGGSMNFMAGTWGPAFAISSSTQGLFVFNLAPDGSGGVAVEQAALRLPHTPAGIAYQDGEANIWLTNGYLGLLKVAREKQLFKHWALPSPEDGRPAPGETSCLMPLGTSLLVGTSEGLLEVDTATGGMRHFKVTDQPGFGNIIWNFRRADEQALWVGTQVGVVTFNPVDGTLGRLPRPHPPVLDSVPITVLMEDGRRRVWFGLGLGGGVVMYDPRGKSYRTFPGIRGGYPYRYPLQAGEDASGRVWFISDVTGNLVKWDDGADGFIPVAVPGVQGDVDIQTGGFFLDKEKNELWYGVRPAKLVRYRIDDGSASLYDASDGLGKGWISTIAGDQWGRIWLGTTAGISCFDPDMGHVIHYSLSDGLAATDYSSSFYDRARNRMYMGATGVLTAFSPPVSPRDNRPMPIYLTGLTVNNDVVTLPRNGRIQLKAWQNNLTVAFTGVNLANGNENRYQYRLGQEDWTSLEHQSSIRFASLKPGPYQLEVRAARKHGEYGPATQVLHFTIRPPFTATAWFYALLMAVTLGLGYAWHLHRLRQWRRLEAVRSRISRDLHDEIGSRLTNINLMGQIADTAGNADAKSGLLRQIQEESLQISRAMRDIIWSIDPDNDSMGNTLPRMVSHASQLLEPRGITVEADVDDLGQIRLDMEARRDLFLIFKECIHNIIKHSGATQVAIRAKTHPGGFLLEVEDDGKGFDPHGSHPVSGLRYMRQRAEKHRWVLLVESAPGKGSTISLTFKGG